MHIVSKERMGILFSKEDYCAKIFIIKTFGGGVLTITGKVNILRNGKYTRLYLKRKKYKMDDTIL